MSLSFSQAAQLLQGGDRYLILTHQRPDGDTAGSAAALCLALRQLGKTAYLLINPEISKRYAPIHLPYGAPEGFEPAYVISADVADVTMLPDNAKEYQDRVWLTVDHHGTNPGFGANNLIHPEMAACGELIYELVLALGLPLILETAYPIYLAVSTDTGCFKYSNTKAHTHTVAAACLAAGVDGGEINRALFEVKSKARYALESYISKTIEFYQDGRIAVAALPRKVIDQWQADLDDLDNIASVTRTIEGVECGLTLQETADGSVKGSARTTKEVNAAQLCAKLGGGGHMRAAGVTFRDCDMEEAKRRMIQAAEECMKIGK